uniref:UBX domain-containing protein 1-like n=1 Tax=Myxine glutinosa TaxID=7769 RepID=UPI00358E3B37
MADSTTMDSLMEMGFPRNRVEKALAVTGNQGVNLAMDWLFEHSNDPDIDEPYTPPADIELCSTATPTAEVQEPPTDVTPEDLCADEEVDVEEESASIVDTESQEMLSEEEKKEKVKRLEQRLQHARIEREERERQAEVEREKQRRRDGQEMGSARERLRDLEMQQLVEQRTREKQEEKLARQRVKDKIARDKAERAMKVLYEGGQSVIQLSRQNDILFPCIRQFGHGCEEQAELSTAPMSVPMPSVEGKAPKEYNECRIQFRLPDGKQLTGVFGARESLASVRLYLQLNWTPKDVNEGSSYTDGNSNNFGLMTPFPRRVFTEDDMEKPLAELGLVPSALVVVTK